MEQGTYMYTGENYSGSIKSDAFQAFLTEWHENAFSQKGTPDSSATTGELREPYQWLENGAKIRSPLPAQSQVSLASKTTTNFYIKIWAQNE